MIFIISAAPQIKEQFNALVKSFRMAWMIVRLCLVCDGKWSIDNKYY